MVLAWGREVIDVMLSNERTNMDLVALWLLIILSAAAVRVVSTIFGISFLHHKNDRIGLSAGDEDAFMEFIRRNGIKPGN